MISQAKTGSILQKLESSSKEEFAKVVEDIEKNTSFRLWNDGDYSDFENDVTYKDESVDNERYSFNLHFSIDWNEQKCCMVLGENLGSGWDDHHDVPIVYGKPLGDTLVDFLYELKKTTPDDYYLKLTETYPEAFISVVEEANQFSSMIGIH